MRSTQQLEVRTTVLTHRQTSTIRQLQPILTCINLHLLLITATNLVNLKAAISSTGNKQSRLNTVQRQIIQAVKTYIRNPQPRATNTKNKIKSIDSTPVALHIRAIFQVPHKLSKNNFWTIRICNSSRCFWWTYSWVKAWTRHKPRRKFKPSYHKCRAMVPSTKKAETKELKCEVGAQTPTWQAEAVEPTVLLSRSQDLAASSAATAWCNQCKNRTTTALPSTTMCTTLLKEEHMSLSPPYLNTSHQLATTTRHTPHLSISTKCFLRIITVSLSVLLTCLSPAMLSRVERCSAAHLLLMGPVAVDTVKTNIMLHNRQQPTCKEKSEQPRILMSRPIND